MLRAMQSMKAFLSYFLNIGTPRGSEQFKTKQDFFQDGKVRLQI